MTTPGLALAHGCPMCHRTLAPHTDAVRDTISGDRFSIVHCPECSLGATAPVPADLEDYYRERYYGNRHSFTARLCVWRRRRFVARQIQPGDCGRLLDVGSGEGDFLLAAGRAGWNASGMEVHGSQTGGARPVFHSLDEAGARAPYRCITLWHVLEHIADPLASLQRLRSMLTSDGVLVVAVPDFGGAQARIFGRHWVHLDVPRHLHHFTGRALARLLDTAGFEVFDTAHQELEYDWFGWIQSALNAVTDTPNVLFDSLAGRLPRVGPLRVAACYVAAILLAVPALALTITSSLAGSGGTLLVAARRKQR